MASAFVVREERGGTTRYRVRFRIGGRETVTGSAGSFPTMREARARRDWVAGELAAMRVPDLGALTNRSPVTVAVAAARWRASRRDVATGTLATYDVALGRLRRRIWDVELAEVTPARVNELVDELAATLKRESIRKTLSVLAMVLDHEAVEPNPVRSPLVKLPRAERRHVSPPTAEHVLEAHRLLPASYRLPLIVLEATGMRVGELEALTWGDMDEPRARWRVTAGVSKTGEPRWVSPPRVVLDQVLDLVPRDDRDLEGAVFAGFGADRFRTALGRACRAAGVPAFSPHDLRHRRVSMLHAGGVSWARIGELVGHADLVTTARTYTHVVADETELDYERMVSRR